MVARVYAAMLSGFGRLVLGRGQCLAVLLAGLLLCCCALDAAGSSTGVSNGWHMLAAGRSRGARPTSVVDLFLPAATADGAAQAPASEVRSSRTARGCVLQAAGPALDACTPRWAATFRRSFLLRCCTSTAPVPSALQGASTYGWEVIDQRNVSECHAASPLQVFGVAFSTPPVDSQGKTHVIEHGILEGSQKYPVKVRGWRALPPKLDEVAVVTQQGAHLIYSLLRIRVPGRATS